LRRNLKRKPYEGKPHVRFDEGGRRKPASTLPDPPGGGQTPRQLTACRSSGCYMDRGEAITSASRRTRLLSWSLLISAWRRANSTPIDGSPLKRLLYSIENGRIQTRNNAIFHSKLRLPSVISFKIQFLRLLFGSLFPILIYAVIVIVFCLIWIARFGTMSDVRFLAGNMEMNLLFLDLFFIMSVCSGADSERPWNLVRFFRAYPSTYSQWQIQYSIAAFLFFLIPRLLSLSGSAIASDNTMLLAIGLLVNTGSVRFFL
jgi:hypothetical protein